MLKDAGFKPNHFYGFNKEPNDDYPPLFCDMCYTELFFHYFECYRPEKTGEGVWFC